MKKIIKCSIFLVVLFLGLAVITFKGYAKDDIDLSIDSEDLYNLTNTYKYNPNYQKNSSRYYIKEDKNGSVVDEGEPLITVFTHGLGGDASHWSNLDGSFAYTKDSLITRLSAQIDSNVYLVKVGNENNLKIYDLTEEIKERKKENNFKFTISKNNEISNIVDISRHSIIVFEASYDAANGTNEEVYTEFNYSISRIVYDVKKLNDGKLPKINLIGHSRGGITNLQYALDHPNLVDSIYSFGTPYLGSTSASIDYYFLGSKFVENEVSESDIVNSNVYKKYLERWNTDYDKLYSKIKVTALGGYSTLYGLCKGLTTEKSIDFLVDETGVSKEKLEVLIPAILGSIDGIVLGFYFVKPTKSIKPLLIKAMMSVASELVNEFDLDIGSDDLAQIITNELFLDYHPPFVSWYNDCLVDLGSQLGYRGEIQIGSEQYKGFKRISKCFDRTNCNFEATSMSNMPAVVHNLEARDEELCNYVLSTISATFKSYDEYEITVINNNECIIDLYNGNIVSSELIIPNYIDGKKVVGISDYAFANNCYGKDNIKTIVLPNTIKYIGKNAFYNSQNITNIDIPNGTLEEIDDNAFTNIPQLKKLNIPSSIKSISKTAFEQSSITDFVIDSNDRYGFVNGVLFDKDVIGEYDRNYEAFYVNPELEDVIMPDNVRIIGKDLFKFNRNIKSINLNDVIYIGIDAFSYSTLEDIYGITDNLSVQNGAFEKTPWKEKQSNDFFQIGTTLIEYNGNLEYVVLDDSIKTISANCFNSNVKGIVIGKNVNSIEDNAFTNCPNLEWILFTSNKEAYLGNNIVSENVKLYVPQAYYEKYKKFDTFKNYIDQIAVKKVNVCFEYNDSYYNLEEEYYSNFDNYVLAPNIVGMDFKYWTLKDDLNITIKPNDIFEFYEDIVLVPVYEKSKYYINFQDYNNNHNEALDYGSLIDISYREGYNFLGWYNLDGILIVDTLGNVYWNLIDRNDVLIAKYSLIDYSIEVVLNGGYSDGNLYYIFNAEKRINSIDIKEPVQFGFVFDYWEYDGKVFKSTDNIYGNITLKAKWLGEEIIIKDYSISTFNINNEYSILNFRDSNDKNYKINILTNVKTVAILGCGKVFTNFQITISYRNTPIILGLDNISIYAPLGNTNGLDAISCYGTGTLYLNINGAVYIQGGKGQNGADNYDLPSQANYNNPGTNGKTGYRGYDGGFGIKAKAIVIDALSSESSLKVIGGRGGNAGNGYHGQQGSNGVNPPSGWFMHPIKGDDGARGGDGGTGGRGGNGGYAICVEGEYNIKVSEKLNYYFKGGNGGTGGPGGIGGRGGAGASDTSGNAFKGVGDPGNGGNGGDGGNGGQGGNGSLATNAYNVLGYGGSGGKGGDYGRGGYGGAGGSAGQNGKNGKKGSMGQNGRDGHSGDTGYSGENTIEQIEGIKNSGYMFRKKFINSLMN